MYHAVFKLVIILFCKIADWYFYLINKYIYKRERYEKRPYILVHGGAGEMSYEQLAKKIPGIKQATNLGYRKLLETGNVLDAVEETVRLLENNENFNCGYGSCLTLDQEIEISACIMDGKTLDFGCAAIVKNIQNPITLARHIMQDLHTGFLCDNGAMKYALNNNFQILLTNELMSSVTLEEYENHKNKDNSNEANPKIENRSVSRISVKSRLSLRSVKKEKDCKVCQFYGDVGVIAIDAKGNIAVGTSSGGRINKLPGYICGTTLVGCGLYADNNYGGCIVIGDEEITKFNMAQKFIHSIEFKLMNAKSVADKILKEFDSRLKGEAGIVGIDANRQIAIAFNTNNMIWAYRTGNSLYYSTERGKNTREEVIEAISDDSVESIFY